MEWWSKMILSVRRAWTAVSTRLTYERTGDGLLKLHDDVQTCEYQDVQVMWEMLSRAESDDPQSQAQTTTWRTLVWSNHGSKAGTTPLSKDHV